MKYFVTTFKGAECIVEKEIKEKLKLKTTKRDGFLIINKKAEFENLKSIIKAGIFLKEFKFKSLREYKKNLKEINFLFIKNSFAVNCERTGNHKFSSKDIEIETASKIKSKVDLTNPKTLIYVLIENESCLIGVDLFQKRLDKRGYRLKPHPNALNSSIAYIALKFSNYSKTKSLLDPFCGSGIIPIEAALMGSKKISASDNQFYYTSATNINSKIAKITLEIAQREITELKSKFDFIVTDPPIATIRGLNGITKLYEFFFKKAESILDSKGILTFVTTRPQPLLNIKSKFKLKKKLILDKNNLKYYILVFKKH